MSNRYWIINDTFVEVESCYLMGITLIICPELTKVYSIIRMLRMINHFKAALVACHLIKLNLRSTSPQVNSFLGLIASTSQVHSHFAVPKRRKSVSLLLIDSINFTGDSETLLFRRQRVTVF